MFSSDAIFKQKICDASLLEFTDMEPTDTAFMVNTQLTSLERRWKCSTREGGVSGLKDVEQIRFHLKTHFCVFHNK